MHRRSRIACGAAALLACTPAFAQYSDDAIRVGLMTDLSGVYKDIAGQGAVIAAEMAINDRGGEIDGVPIELIVVDHESDGEVARREARRLIDEEGVDVFAELVSSSVALPVQEIAREEEVVTLISGAASSSLTGEECSPTGFHWAYDTYSLAAGTARAVVEEGGDTWYFLTADYSFGHALEADTSEFVREAGGEVLGAVRHEFKGSDFTSELLEASASGAKVIGLANAGGDTITAVRQAYELGLTSEGHQLAGLLLFLSEIRTLGLYVANGLQLTTGFYWDLDDRTREWSERFRRRNGLPPTMVQAGVYSSLTHYFDAVADAGTDDGPAVADQLHGREIDDFFARNGFIREDGRLVHDMALMEVKAASESTGTGDYLEHVRTIPGDEAYRPLEEGICPHVTE